MNSVIQVNIWRLGGITIYKIRLEGDDLMMAEPKLISEAHKSCDQTNLSFCVMSLSDFPFANDLETVNLKPAISTYCVLTDLVLM